VAELSAQRVRSKQRAAVRRREDQIEEDEIESGELNLIPYLDIVTNLVLFLLATLVTQILFVQLDTQLPDKAPPSTQVQPTPPPNPDDQPLKLVVSVTRDQILLWSFSQLEGTLKQPKAQFPRGGTAKDPVGHSGDATHPGDKCDGDFLCESNSCGPEGTCVKTEELAHWVYDYRALNKALIEIAGRRYNGRPRKADTYQIVLMADPLTPYATVVSVMAAMRCKMPEAGAEPFRCALPTKEPKTLEALKPIKAGIASIETLKANAAGVAPPDADNDKSPVVYDTTVANYDAAKMTLFPDILFSTGFE
jgi:biopolymer transport protein ExbD